MQNINGISKNISTNDRININQGLTRLTTLKIGKLSNEVNIGHVIRFLKEIHNFHERCSRLQSEIEIVHITKKDSNTKKECQSKCDRVTVCVSRNGGRMEVSVKSQ